MNNSIIIVTGPTASGKSGLALEIAKCTNGEIISADSMQVYRGMDIGTAKIREEEMQNVPHHLINILSPTKEFSVAEYSSMAYSCIDQLHQKGKLPIIVGGTTLYIQSILDNVQFFPMPKDEKLRLELEKKAKAEGNQALWEELNLLDSDLASRLHINNLGRIIRGIEVVTLTGKPLSVWQKESVAVPSPYKIVLCGLSYKNRQSLYEKINNRVDEMIEKGLLGEIKTLSKVNLSKTARQAIGYKEFWSYIEGKETLEECIAKLKMHTRRYAKRQLTWMRSRRELNWLYRDEIGSNAQIIDSVNNIIKSFKDSE